MVYRAIGLMSGSSLDGLDIAFVELHEASGKWNYEIKAADCYPYTEEWVQKLKTAVFLNAEQYLLLHTSYGYYIGELVNSFIDINDLNHQVQLIASHGHTTFHVPSKKMTAQLGDGAAIAAVTGINVVSDLRAMDVALGGHGAPIVPIGEKLLLGDYDFFLNIGGIANISYNSVRYVAFDVCPANRVLNLLANDADKTMDEGGEIASQGKLNNGLLKILDDLEYYKLPYPKSLSNDFGTDVVYPIIRQTNIHLPDALRTFVEHICRQIKHSISGLTATSKPKDGKFTLMATGGGAHNSFLVQRLKDLLAPNVDVVVPEKKIIDYKEALVMALIGVLRWREENNVMASVTGSLRDSIGGAIWIGQEA